MVKSPKKKKNIAIAGVCGVLLLLGIVGGVSSEDSTAGQSESSFRGDRDSYTVQTSAPDVTPEPPLSTTPMPAESEILPSAEPVTTPNAEPTLEQTKPPETPKPTPTPAPSYKLVASRESDKYHKPNCRWVENINPENVIYFDTAEKAIAAGYKACGTCKPR